MDQFREDIESHLRGFPVTAHPLTWRYSLGRTLRRHLTATVLSLALLVAIIVGAAAAIHYGARARRQSTDILTLASRLSDSMMALQTEARTSAFAVRRGSETVALLTSLQQRYPEEEQLGAILVHELADYGNLLGHPATASVGNTAAAIAVLSNGVEVAEDQVRRHPRSQACALNLSRIRCSLGSVEIEEDNYAAATVQFARAVEAAERGLTLGPARGEGLRTLADAVANVSRVSLHERRLEECRVQRRHVVELHRQAGQVEHLDHPDWEVAGSLGLLGWVERELAAYDEALSHYQESSRILADLMRRGSSAFEIRSTSARNLTQQGLILFLMGRHAESRAALDRGLAAFRALIRLEPRSSPTRRYMATNLAYLARAAARDGQLAAARRYADEAVTLIRHVASADPANHKVVDDAAEIHEIVDPIRGGRRARIPG